MIVEMTIVTPPCILDFAKVRLDQPPDFSEETRRDAEEAMRDAFGGHCSEVLALLWELRKLGIYYLDPKPANIMLEDWDEQAEDLL
jgi:hypothetical protein